MPSTNKVSAVENEWETTPVTSKPVENEWDGVEPTPFTSNRVEIEWEWG